MKLSKLNRVLHRWGSLLIAIPLSIVIVTGVILLLKKEIAWIQPATQQGASAVPALSFQEILTAVQQVPQADVESWENIDRLDIRPGKGMLKVRCKNRWEVQLDASTGEVLQVAYRRSDFIESIHDGSFFHEYAKLGIFLPSALILAGLWVTGLYLFFLPYYAKWNKQRRKPSIIETNK